MAARRLALILVLTAALFPDLAYGEKRATEPPLPTPSDQQVHLSLRAFGLSVHLFDVSADAPHYPLKLDENAVAVLSSGLALSLDWPTGFAYAPFVRLGLGAYADCAQQPAGYVGLMGMLPEASWRYFTFLGGVGLGLAARRNWKTHVDSEHVSATFNDWGAVEGTWGVYGELDFLFHNEARSREIVLSVVPGVPHILVFSVGMRWALGR